MTTGNTRLPDLISNDAGEYYVPVHEHTDATRLAAADEVAATTEGYDSRDGKAAAQAIAQLAATATAFDLTKHTEEPDTDHCGCEGIGWWCDAQPDNEHTRSFWMFDVADIERLRPGYEDEAEAEAAS